MNDKTIETLIDDMEEVLNSGCGWTDEISEWVADDIAKSLSRQFNSIGTQRKGTLRLSGIGTPCERKLWYDINSTTQPEPLPASARNKFIFGDLTESYILGLVKASGHSLEGLQDRLDVCGIRGHRDCVIDGMLIDVKSCSSFSYTKFKQHELRDNDPFGYISQLSSYLYGSRNDPLVTYKNEAGFLAFDKQFAHICLDRYDLSNEVANKEQEVQQKKDVVKLDKPPQRPTWERKYRGEVVETAEDWEDGQSGNRKLSTQCSYCQWKHECWDGLRTFVFANGPRYLTKVVREPKAFEVTDENF